MQDLYKMRRQGASAWTEIRQPDSGLEANFETTYKDDATRSQTGKGKFTPMFTVESFGYKATDVSVAEMATILQIVMKGSYFEMHYFSPYYGMWRDGLFYVGRGSLAIGRVKESNERYESLSMNIIGVNPLV